MRVALVVTGGFDRSGRERVIPALLWLVERLARRHDVHVYVLRYHHEPCEYSLLGARVHDLGRPEGLVRQHATLMNAWRTIRPDVVHAYWALPCGLAAASAARRLGIPSVVTLDSGEFSWLPDLDPRGYGLQGSWRQRAAVTATLRLATRLTVCTRYMERLAHSHGAAPARIPIGIDLERFERSDTIEGPPWRLIHVASLNPVKDHVTLLHAFRRVVDRVPPCHLDIVGEDTLHGRVQQVAATLQLEPFVTFHGVQTTDRVASLMAQSHLHVVSSRHEAAGVVILEAAACGVPTVGTAVGYIADWMPDRSVGVPTQEPAALSEAIVTTLTDAGRRHDLALAARAWTVTHDADWTAAAFERIYEEVI